MIKNIEDIEAEKWVNIEATVQEIWENDHPAIRQVGLLKDSTGIIKFVSWEISNMPLIRQGTTYKFEGMPVTEYEGRLSVSIVRTTEITPIKGTAQSELPIV